nr:hypothetical protein [Ktedonobacteraceae bacterium]
MDDLTTKYTALTAELTAYYRCAFSSPTACRTLAVYPAEVDIVKWLICLVGGREACEVMVHCWNEARRDYPKLLLVTELDFPTCRDNWNRRG